jgi:hypothetical protein
MKWSFSADRCFRRCQRQYFFREIAAWHNARDPLRREAFLLKQVKTLQLWRGNLVHQGIENFVVPALQENREIRWPHVVQETLAIAERQFQFSAQRRYREHGVSKAAYPLDYCALACHEDGQQVDHAEVDRILESVRHAIENLAEMESLWRHVRGRGKYFCEVPIAVSYEGVRIEIKPDLLVFRGYGKPTIIDWKVYEDASGSDARLQEALYAWVLCRHDKWKVSRPEEVELIEVQLLGNSMVRHGLSDEAFDELEDKIYRSVHEMIALTERKDYAEQDLADFGYAQSQNSCTFCSFRKPCLKEQQWFLT